MQGIRQCWQAENRTFNYANEQGDIRHRGVWYKIRIWGNLVLLRNGGGEMGCSGPCRVGVQLDLLEGVMKLYGSLWWLRCPSSGSEPVHPIFAVTPNMQGSLLYECVLLFICLFFFYCCYCCKSKLR